MLKQLDGVRLSQLFESGYRNLKKNITTINDLNVFPVPDGDTGTNMAKTFGGGLRSSTAEGKTAGQYMSELAKGVLLSARGNSGVILSQFVHGLFEGLQDKETVTVDDVAHAFSCATKTAYSSVIKPTEGTVLTVIREASEFLSKQSFDSFEAQFAALLEQMKKTLAKTPDMLPVLKEANVVDSGGAGLVCIFEGMYADLCGESIEDTHDIIDTMSAVNVSGSFGTDSVLEYGYCTEFVLQLMNAKTDISAFERDSFVAPLMQMGDSIVAVCSGDIVKVHIHTFTPEKVLEYARSFGEFVTLKIENMSVQHSELTDEKPAKEHQKYAIVSVASGEGIIEYFYSIGAHCVIDGGQTNNPPVEAFINAFESFDADHIIVLPNNSNVVLTAQQAAELYTAADVRVIPTRSVVEGYSALSMMNLWSDTVEELLSDMTSNLDYVTTGLITTATRDAEMNGVSVKKDQYIGLDNKNILACGDDKVEVALQLVATVNANGEKEVITVFYGGDVTDEQATALRGQLEKAYPMCDIGFVDGKQAVYSFIIALE